MKFLKGAWLVVLTVFGLAACQTTEKPSALTNAQSAIEEAESQDVDDVLPRSMELANRQLSEAQNLWEDSRDMDKENEREKAEELRQRSVSLANSAKSIAQNGTEIVGRIESWDQNLQEYVDLRNSIARAEAVASQPAPAAIPATEQLLIGEELLTKVPVAYFETSKAEINDRYQSNVDQIATFLNEHPDAKATLSGYADPRGDGEFNKMLSEQRATAIADKLKEAGVKEEQIVVEALGEEPYEATDNQNLAELQLARKVEVSIEMEAH